MKIIAFLLLASLASASQNVVVVLDDSGSMQTRMQSNRKISRMEAAKSALIKVVATLPDDTKFGVITLNGDWNSWAIPLERLNKQQAIRTINKFKPTGGTPLGGCLKVGSDSLLTLRKKEQYGTYKLLVISDGEANDQNLVEQYLPDILSRGIIVDVIGVDMSATHSLATKVNNYRQGDDIKQLEQAISAVFAESSTDNHAEEDFQLLASLPDEMASKLLTALIQENHPIGELPIIQTNQPNEENVKKPNENPVFIGLLALILLSIAIIAVKFILN